MRFKPLDEAMADFLSKRARSALMGRIKGAGNRTTEVRLRDFFRAYHITGWRRNSRLAGRPDFVFPAARVAVFVDGCFWHGCRIHGEIPASNAEFWRRKIERNQLRDAQVKRLLRRGNWRVLRIWEHELRRANESRLQRRFINALRDRLTEEG